MRSLVAGLVLVLVACGAAQPSMESWLSQVWRPTSGMIPEGPEASPAECERVLGELRDRAETIRPAPFPELGDAAEGWMKSARSLMFDCASAEADFDYASGRADLDALAGEVEALIEEG